VDPDRYCRELESYLCRKNDGHLVRIVGPAFDRVAAWAAQGIPLTVAFEGIDRYFERYYRRGPRRRPVRIEFCEADVLDAFDAWRRAVGVPRDQEAQARRRPSLAAHLERAIARLTALRGSSSQTARALDDVLDATVRRLDVLLPQARSARGDRREALCAELERLDRDLMDAALERLPHAELDAILEEARAQLVSFRSRMTPADYDRACRAAAAREVRMRLGLPVLSFE
jgi:hypothetical protein